MSDLFLRRPLDASSSIGPSAAALPTAGTNDRVVIAWRPNDSRNLHVGVLNGPDIFNGPFRVTTLGDTSDLAPSLLSYEGNLWLAWQGTNGARTVNVARLVVAADGSVTLTSRQFVNGGTLGGGSTSGPLLYGSPLYSVLGLTALDANGEAAEAYSRPAGAEWEPAARLPHAVGGVGPAAVLARPEQTFYYASTRPDGHLVCTQAGFGPGFPLQSAETSPHNPSLAWFGGSVALAWTGTNPSHNLNYAALDFTSGLADPVTFKTILQEQSLAAPTLFVVDPQHFEKLCLVWSDLNGQINVGIVIAH